MTCVDSIPCGHCSACIGKLHAEIADLRGDLEFERKRNELLEKHHGVELDREIARLALKERDEQATRIAGLEAALRSVKAAIEQTGCRGCGNVSRPTRAFGCSDALHDAWEILSASPPKPEPDRCPCEPNCDEGSCSDCDDGVCRYCRHCEDGRALNEPKPRSGPTCDNCAVVHVAIAGDMCEGCVNHLLKGTPKPDAGPCGEPFPEDVFGAGYSCDKPKGHRGGHSAKAGTGREPGGSDAR